MLNLGTFVRDADVHALQLADVWEPVPGDEFVAVLGPQRLEVWVLASAHWQLLHLVMQHLVGLVLLIAVSRRLLPVPGPDLLQSLITVAEQELEFFISNFEF